MSRRRTLATLLLAGLVSAGCASTGAVPHPFPVPGGWSAPSSPASHPTPADGYGIAGTALGLRGSPYRNGGSDPSGFDCSGFIWYVFAQHGVRVPRTVTEQFRAGTPVDQNGLEAGDLVFFATDRGGEASHVGMAIGGDEFVHAPSSHGEVRVERMGSGYWGARFVGARRIR